MWLFPTYLLGYFAGSFIENISNMLWDQLYFVWYNALLFDGLMFPRVNLHFNIVILCLNFSVCVIK